MCDGLELYNMEKCQVLQRLGKLYEKEITSGSKPEDKIEQYRLSARLMRIAAESEHDYGAESRIV